MAITRGVGHRGKNRYQAKAKYVANGHSELVGFRVTGAWPGRAEEWDIKRGKVLEERVLVLLGWGGLWRVEWKAGSW